MGQNQPIHLLHVNTVYADEHLPNSSTVLEEFHLSGYEVWQKLTNILEEATSSVFTLKMDEATTSNFLAEKQGMINFYQSTLFHNQDDSSVCRHGYENLIYHLRATNSKSISFSVNKITSCPTFKIFKIKIIANKF